jgi:CheY-like chemotaxis protein
MNTPGPDTTTPAQPDSLRSLLDAISSSTNLLEQKMGNDAEIARLRAATRQLMEMVATQPASTVPATPSGSTHRVLYIEDEAINFGLVHDAFTQLRPEIELTHAATGENGIALARASQPHVILLDLNLPDMHGADVLHSLQQDPATASTPVVVLSADATASQIERLLSAGARNYLIKPFDIDEFLTVIDSTFEESRCAR